MEVRFNEHEQITKNFQWWEFICKDGTLKVDMMTFKLFKRLQMLREILETPIRITSGYRSPEHNTKIGGAPNSYHMKAMAADIQWDFNKYSLEEVARIADALGLYVIIERADNTQWLHLDTRRLI